MSRPGPDVIAVAVAGALVAAWLGGWWVADLARVALGLGLLALVLTRGRTSAEAAWAREPRVVLTVAGLAVAAIIASLSGRWLLGKTGVDFAVVSQVADSVTRRGALESCIPRGAWTPFLLHHFTPAFFVVGALGVSGLSAPWAVILFGALALALSVLALWKLGGAWGSARAGAWLALAWVLHPATRVGLGWSVHDETLALPGLAFALLALERRRWVLLLGCALWVAACKESLLAVAACLCFAGAWSAWRSREGRPAGWLALAAVVLGLSAVAYVVVQPLLFHKQFDHFDKLRWAGTWWEMLGGKLLWLSSVFAPVGIALIARRRPWWPPVLVVTPLVFIVAVSGFEEMWKPFNYYALLPSFATLVSAAHGFMQAPLKQPRLGWAVALMACLSFGGSLGFVYPALRGPRPDATALEALAPELRVYAVVGALPHVLHTARPLPWEPSQPVPPDADVLVLTDTDPQPNWGHDCGGSRGWRLRCR